MKLTAFLAPRARPWPWLAAALVLLACDRGSDARGLSMGQDSTAIASSPTPAASRRQAVPSEPDRERWPAKALESGRDFTVGIVDHRPTPQAVALLTDVRAARHAGFDRIVFELGSGAAPGFHLEYVDKPVRRCGSGDVATIAGDAWLEVRLEPANAHTASGAATIANRDQKVGLKVVSELEQTCDFEAVVTWVVGVEKPNSYRVLTLNDPLRLVVDVKH